MRRGLTFAAVVTAAATVFVHVACSTFESEGVVSPPDASATDATGDAAVDADTTVVLDPGEDPDAGVVVDAQAIPEGGKIVFVTREQIRGGGIGGRDNADTLCTTLGNKAGFTGTFAAFLRDGPAGAAAHIPATGNWYRVDGALVFSTQPSPTISPAVFINVNEYGGQVIAGAKAWTAATGTTGSDGTCGGWTDTSAGIAAVGSAFDLALWANDGTRSCNDFARLYCFQQ